MVIHSFAKLNLFLKVIDKRTDNYHNLDTLFERISLSDTITLNGLPSSSIIVKCSDKSVPSGEDNLCFKAASLLRDKFAPERGARISIFKRIPVGAGLGGGSSNAAAVLLGLNRIWRLNLSRSQLVKIALNIGSDVPFFIYEKPFALGSGRGEIIKPLVNLNKVKLWHILVVPKIKVSTPSIYASWDRFARLTKPACNVKILTSELAKKRPFLRGEMFFNSLQQVTGRMYPEVMNVINALSGLGLESVLMSGSGSAVFSPVSSRKEALQLATAIKKQHKSWRTYVVSTA